MQVHCLIRKFHNHVQNIQARHQGQGLASLVGHNAPVNMVDSMEEVNVSGKTHRKWHFCWLIFCAPIFHKSLKFFGTSITSLDPETVELPAAMRTYPPCFAGACGLPEKLSLALPPH